jgi:RNA polymerase II subunit A small phosphatase-like protein
VICQAPNPTNKPKPSKDFQDLAPPPPSMQSKPRFDLRTKGYLPPKARENEGKKTLVLDLDETMIHSWFKPVRDPDIFLEVKIKNKFSKIFVQVRPGVQEFLDEVEKLYEVVFFTASVSTYAIPLITKLDRNKYKYQMLFRQHCDVLSGSFVKDLSKIGRELKDIIILDNTPN